MKASARAKAQSKSRATAKAKTAAKPKNTRRAAMRVVPTSGSTRYDVPLKPATLPSVVVATGFRDVAPSLPPNTFTTSSGTDTSAKMQNRVASVFSSLKYAVTPAPSSAKSLSRLPQQARAQGALRLGQNKPAAAPSG